MSREGLIPQLQTHGIQVKEMKYGQQSVSVYQGTFQNRAAAIKVLAYSQGTDYTQLQKESQTLMSLSHPNILQQYDCFWVNNGLSDFFVIVTEWCEKDLGKDMKQRAENNFPWREEELWSLTFELVSALAYMQSYGYSHRDIKPENIFLTLTKNAKLGDFGSARSFSKEIFFSTLTGTPFYLSPKLKEAFSRRDAKVVHNSFKSDVYSLGLTLLSLILLAQPISLAKANLSNEEVQAVISIAPCSDVFKSMLMWMLSVDEDIRCDFQMLNDWLHGDSLSLNNTPCFMQQETANAAIAPSQETESIEAKRINEFRISSHITGIPSLQRTSEVVCMQCRKVVDRYSETALCEVVQLYCEPDKHMFCSRECCRDFLSQGVLECPQCGIEISTDTIGCYQNGSAEITSETRIEKINSSEYIMIGDENLPIKDEDFQPVETPENASQVKKSSSTEDRSGFFFL